MWQNFVVYFILSNFFKTFLKLFSNIFWWYSSFLNSFHIRSGEIAGWELEHYLRYAERTVEDYSNDEIEGALAARFTLVRSKGKKDGKYREMANLCLQKRQKDFEEMTPLGICQNQLVLSMLKCFNKVHKEMASTQTLRDSLKTIIWHENQLKNE